MSKTTLAYLVGGVALLAILIDVEPRFGGWLLLLIVLGLLLNPRARSIIMGAG